MVKASKKEKPTDVYDLGCMQCKENNHTRDTITPFPRRISEEGRPSEAGNAFGPKNKCKKRRGKKERKEKKERVKANPSQSSHYLRGETKERGGLLDE